MRNTSLISSVHVSNVQFLYKYFVEADNLPLEPNDRSATPWVETTWKGGINPRLYEE